MTKNNRNALKGAKSEKRVSKKLGITRKAGPNSPDLKSGKQRAEVKDYKKPLTKTQLQKAYQQNRANVIVSTQGFTQEALSHAEKNMPTVQLRSGKAGEQLVKRRKPKRSK